MAALGPEKDIQHKQLERHQHRSRFGLLKHEFKTEMRVCAKEPLKSIGSALITDRGLSCAAGGGNAACPDGVPAILLLHTLLWGITTWHLAQVTSISASP